MLNKEYRIVYTAKRPAVKSLGAAVAKRVRIGIGAGKIQNYIGLPNAIWALQCALTSQEDKVTCNFRKRGTVEFYRK